MRHVSVDENGLFYLKKIGKGFIENEWKAVSNSLLQRKHVWVVQMER